MNRLFTPWVRGVIGRYGLPFWFGVWALVRLEAIGLSLLGTDAHLYVAAARAFVAGGDPWQVSVTNAQGTFHYAGLPPTVLLTVPLTPLPQAVSVAVLWLMGLGAAIATVRALRLPIWWLAFPPLVESVYVGNPHTIVLAALVGGPAFLAPLVKIYGIVPLLAERRIRTLGLFAAAAALTLVLAPGLWTEYLGRFFAITGRLAAEAGGGFSAWSLVILTPILVPTAIIGLAVLARWDLPRAGWLGVPALWPASQFMYGSFVMPVARPIAAAIVAVPLPGLVVGAVAVEAVVVAASRRARRSGQPEAGNWRP